MNKIKEKGGLLTMGKRVIELELFLKTLTRNLSEAVNSNVIPKEWLCGQEGNQGRMLHGRMLWMLGKTGDSLDYVVEIDSGFSRPKGGQFRPDIQLWTKEPRLKFLIEYEGTNSQDTRILWKDLQHYSDSINADCFPEYWLILYTFPDHPIDKTSPWLRLENSIDKERFKRNPHSYFMNLLDAEIEGYIDCRVQEAERILFLINLTRHGLEIDFPKSMNKKYLFK